MYKQKTTWIPLLATLFCVAALSFIHSPSVLTPVVSLLLLIFISSLFLHAMKARRYGIVLLGVFSSIFIFAGKFDYQSHWAVSVGIFGMFFSCVMNLFLTDNQ